MRVKRYIVDSMPDALHKIRTDLGKDAVILSTKEVKTGGFLGLFGKKRIEVIAALEEGPNGSGKSGPEGGAQARPSSKAAAAAAVTAVAKARQEEEAEKAADPPRPNKEQELRQREFAELLLRQSALQNETVPAYGSGENTDPAGSGLLKKQIEVEAETVTGISGASAPGQMPGGANGAATGQRPAPAQPSSPQAPVSFVGQGERPADARSAAPANAGQPAGEEALPVIPQRPPAAAAAAYAQARPAAADQRQSAPAPAAPRSLPQAEAAPSAEAPQTGGFADEQAEALRAALAASRAEAAAEAAAAQSAAREDLMLAELQHLKTMMAGLARPSAQPQLPPVWGRLEEHLLAQEVQPDLVRQLIESARRDLAASADEADARQAAEAVRKRMLALFPPPQGKPISADSKIVHIVGPTGVGKTTTIAKLAADQVLKQRRKVGLITSDTYRIAAIEQLRTYANILDVPVEVVFSPADLTRALHNLREADVIFMDTAGRNFRNEMYVSELNTLIRHQGPSETILVLSLTSKYSDMKAITANFSKFKVDKVLFTKMDETYSYGAMLNLLDEFPIRLSYVTDGQNVPDDIMVADENRIVDAVLEGYSYE
ncbi:flagellar biosynthesis protein FlhF [Paenibacillus sp. UNC499MF]|uniref:flagellar biosynthesis protein FlhF n=1 Tax=Paenibacillus sp. UNC499MF TaxID=1502751 RepID=UPI0008A02B91|nr:flagellar biosynthesis protein FlhF [Paenibacillus sp. UNC499MF]SEF58375.1 SRP54-type protein, GTPase domain [Paenibacillus sp. UNC499MF]